MEINSSVNQNKLECRSQPQKTPIPNSDLFPNLRALDPTRNRRPIRLVSDRVYTIGRDRRRCDIVVGSRYVSKRHCQIFLHSSDRKLCLIDGFFLSPSSDLDEIRRRFRLESRGFEARVSSNGVLINGRRVKRGFVAELSVGDEILFGCSKRMGRNCRSGRFGFFVERIGDQVFDLMPKGGYIDYKDLVNKATVLLRQCRSVLQSVDPVSCLRTLETSHSAEIIGSENSDGNEGEIDGNRNEQLGSSTNVETSDSVEIIGFKNSDRNIGKIDENGVEERPLGSKTNFEQDKRNECNGDFQENGEIGFFSDGRMFFLNRLENMSPSLPGEPKTVTLPELLHPVGSLVRVFMATFTSDVSWLLSYCQLPYHLPITIACHSAQRCWSANHESRTAAPYSNYPNLLLVYPPFPEVIAFGKDRKKQGVACHHPKLIVLQRKESIRVIVTSANLTPKQWNYVTNTVWLQDFLSRSSPDFSTLFSTIEDSLPDFAAQLGGFIASLISDVPSQAHWIAELTKYDFGGAVGHLVASVPGMHVKKSSYSETNLFTLGKHSGHSQSTSMKYLGSAQVSVVGLGHRFHTAADSNGAQLKTLASFLGKFQGNARSTLEVLLRRNINIPADSNAMSVFVADVDEFSEGDSVQLGFLPRDTAMWVSPLHDAGFFSFSAFIHPMETLAAVLGGSNTKVPLLLHVSQGANFVEISRLIQPDHIAPLCSLMASIQRPLGIWRLQEVLSQYKWPEMLETDFIYSSSSVGTSVNPQFIAAFSAAAGKRSANLPESEESDPEWGCWTTIHELQNPSIKFLFPTIDRVKSGRHGVQPSRCLLSLPEKTWQRLRPAGIFHDAIPHPSNRLGYPMHVKVARRRFQSRTAGIPPFGWIYCGSHNFSPAAWGQVLLPSSESNILRPRLHICNYELGVILIAPPPYSSNCNKHNIDDVILPFVMPAPRYQYSDKPATAQAMREALAEASAQQREIDLVSITTEEMNEDIPDENEEEMIDDTSVCLAEEEEEKIYAEMLWSQLESSGS